ncbi:MAG: M20 family peptidase [Bacillota bacterium]|nr:M20 family peptidase [Bacillota bacterium]
MKQEMITYLSTIKNDIFNLSKYLYENPESSFNEHKAYNYIVEILKKNHFSVTDHYLKIPTAFMAQYGKGHPKICFFCEYDALENSGHLVGHNLISAASIAAGLALSKVINKTGGSVIILGCPGEFIGSAKITMAKQGTFNDIDAALMIHPDIYTAESGTSNAVLPLKITYTGKDELSYRKVSGYSSLDACIFTFNALTLLSKGFEEGCSIDGVIVQGGSSPHMMPSKTESKFYIRTPKMAQAECIERTIKELVKTTSSLMDISSDVCLYEMPYDELITNRTLSRLFSHNLKESGIIDVDKPKDTASGLSIGTISHIIPCIHPYINIVDDSNIKYSSNEFAAATISDLAQDRIMKAAQALAQTGFDLITNENLLKEARLELCKDV